METRKIKGKTKDGIIIQNGLGGFYMKLGKLISTFLTSALMLPMFIFASPTETDARATYQLIRDSNGIITRGLITIGQTSGDARVYHQPQNDQTRTEIPLNGGATYSVTCNGYYSVLYYDNSGKMLRFDAWNVTNLGACGM